MPLLKTYHWYTPELVTTNPDHIFIFGDNLQRYGRAGQAQIRDLSNALGLATKRTPSCDPHAFFDDDSVSDAIAMLQDVTAVMLLADYNNVVIPFDSATDTTSLGCGLSEMPTRAPRLYDALARAFPRSLNHALLNLNP